MKRLLCLIPAFFLCQVAVAQITFINGSNTNAASDTARTGIEPTNTAENDLVIAIGSIVTTGSTWTDPADFVEVNQRAGSGNTGSMYVGYKVRGSDAGSGYVFSTDGAAAQIALTLLTFRGLHTSTPLDVTFVEANHSNTGTDDLTTAAPAITTATNGAVVVLLQYFSGGISGVTAGPPANYTTALNSLAAARSHVSAYRAIATAGTETPGAWTTTGGTTQDPTNWTLAIKPASGASIVPIVMNQYRRRRQ
jgi:hypothetical protein